MNETLTWQKIFSGKFIFTIITAIVFAYAVYAKILNGEQTYGIIMLIVAFYFSKPTPIADNTKTITASTTTIEPVKKVEV